MRLFVHLFLVVHHVLALRRWSGLTVHIALAPEARAYLSIVEGNTKLGRLAELQWKNLEVTFGRFTLTEAFEEGIHFWGGDFYYQIVVKTVFFGVLC